MKRTPRPKREPRQASKWDAWRPKLRPSPHNLQPQYTSFADADTSPRGARSLPEGRRRAPRERERSEGPDARSRPFGRAEHRCAGGAGPERSVRDGWRRGRACVARLRRRNDTAQRPLAVTVTEGGGSPSHENDLALPHLLFPVRRARGPEGYASMRRVRPPQTAAPAQELPIPPGEGRGEGEAAVRVCLNLLQPRAGAGTPSPLGRGAG